MKSLLTRSVTQSWLLSSVLVSSQALSPLPALSIPDEVIVQKLQSVPVYTILDKLDKFVSTGNDNGTGTKIDLFFSSEDALRALSALQKKYPVRARKWQVTPVPLATIYQLLRENQTQTDRLSFVFYPNHQEVRSAINLLRQHPWQYERGVPLFFATLGKERSFIPIEHNGREVFPLFFEAEQLQEMVGRFIEQHPDLASEVNTEVVSLEWLIGEWQKKDSESLNKIILVVSQESQALLRSRQTQNQD